MTCCNSFASKLPFLLAACGAAFLLSCTNKSSKEFSVQGKTMGTSYSVKLVAEPEYKKNIHLIEKKIEKLLNRVNQQMSTYQVDSEISVFNKWERTEWHTVSPGFISVVKESIRISKLTKGAFDVTVGPLVNLWGFGPEGEREKIPSMSEIREARERTGFWRLSYREEPPGLRKSKRKLVVDLSAIAKGYAVDEIAAYLESQKIKAFMVEIGGELKAKGRKANGDKWKIAIERPEVGQRKIQKILELENLAMATSGDYRNYFEKDGERFSHTINPNMGKPISHRLASVTVLDDSCMTADAWATALMVLGPTKGFDLAKKENLKVLFLIKEKAGFKEVSTPAFDEFQNSK